MNNGTIHGTWPLIPDLITKNLNGSLGLGIIPNVFLRGLLTEVASRMENPVTILEFPPNGEPYRTDATSIHFDLHPPCKKFRECNRSYCLRNDIIHANLFQGLKMEDLESQLRLRIDSPSYKKAVFDFFGTESNVSVRCLDSRVYIEYDCLILGYRELVFPIIVEHKVIAVLFLGELTLDDQSDGIDKRRRAFFSRYKGSFPGKLMDEIAEEDKEWRKSSKNILSKEGYQQLIKKVIAEISQLEERLCYEHEVQRKNFVGLKIESYIKKLRSEMRQPLPKGNEGLKRFWRRIEDVLALVIKDFPAMHIAIFAQEKFSKDPPKTLSMVAGVGLAKKSFKNHEYNLETLPGPLKKRIITSIQESVLLDGLQSQLKLDQRRDLIRLFPSPLSTHSIFVIWVRYDNEIWPRLLVERIVKSESDKIFTQAIVSFYTFISSIYSSILTDFANNLIENTIRVLGHETGQITSGIDAIRQKYLTAQWFELDIDKINKLNNDVNGLLRQMDFMNKSVKSLYSEVPQPNKEEFYAFKELLFKWRGIFSLELLKKNLKIDVIETQIDDPLRTKVYADKLLLEQALYNLVNNAIKYCYRGTNIRIDCRKTSDTRESPHILSVTDYGGIEIKDEDKRRIFELFERGEDVKGIEGFGIGLYVAKKMVKANGGNIRVTCKKVSNFSVHLMETFLAMHTIRKGSLRDGKFFDRVEQELDTLEVSGIYNKIVAKDLKTDLPYFMPTRIHANKLIDRPTFEITFSIEIPPR